MIGLILSIVSATVPGVDSTVDDDQIQAILDENTTRNVITSAIGFAMAIVALLGARMYNVPMLCAVVLWFLVSFGIGMWFSIDLINSVNEVYREQGEEEIGTPAVGFVISAVFTALWMYPHVGLILEIRSGIMSSVTYPREEYSCCCTDKRPTH